MTKKWNITLRRKEISEHTLDLVVEAPTLKAALTAAPKVVVSDLDWELYDYRWAHDPVVANHTPRRKTTKCPTLSRKRTAT